MSGKLIMGCSGLGHPDDIPSRALEAIREADLLVFEEDRAARFHLKTAGVHREYLRFSEHQQAETLSAIGSALSAGKTVLYMSDQGVPTLADPGLAVLGEARAAGARLQVIPGPSAVTTAMAVCPFPCNSFTCGGMLPRDSKNRCRQLARWSGLSHPLVLMDTPYRLNQLLADAAKTLGPGRDAFLALDISGKHEDYWHASLGELHKRVTAAKLKLNFVLIIGVR